MGLFIEITSPDGAVSQLVVSEQSTSVQVLPGHQYRLLTDDQAASQAVAQLKRSGESLVIEIPESAQQIELTTFFASDNIDTTFSLSSLGGETDEVITPQSEPIAALAEGGFLMWASPAIGTHAPQDPGSELAWRPIAGIAGGVVLIGAAAGGGSSSAVASDRTPPSAPVLDTELNTNSTKPVISGTADANSAITITIDVGNTGQRVTYTTQADNNGNWSVDLANDTPFSGSLPAAGLPVETPSTARVIATDAAGNAGPVTEGSIMIDVIAPVQTASVTEVSSDAPAPVDANGLPNSDPNLALGPGDIARGGQTNDPSPTIRGTIDGPLEDGDRVIVWRGDTAVGEAILTGLEWTFVDNGAPQGTHAYSAQVTDRAGNGSVDGTSYTVTVDATAPDKPTIDTVSDDDVLTFNDAEQAVLITGTAEANTRIDLTWGAVTQQTTADAQGQWSVSFERSLLPGNGIQPVTVQATDAFGNVSAAGSRDVNVVTGLPSSPVFDTSPGSILSGPVAAINGSEFGSQVALTGMADPGNEVTVTLTPVNGGAAITATVLVNDQGRFSASFTHAQLPDGNYNAQASAADIVGNVTPGPTLAILVDTNAPTGRARIDAATDDEGASQQVSSGALINDDSPTLSGSVTGAAPGEVVRILRDGQVAGTAEINNGRWSFTDRNLSDGDHEYVVSVIDEAGNSGPRSPEPFGLIIDTTPPPAPVLNTVAGNNIVTGAEAAGGVTISGSAAANSDVRIDWAGQVLTTQSDANGNWSVNYATVPGDGLTQVSATVRDSAGNTNSAFQNVRIDTQPPAAPEIAAVEGDNQVNAADAANGIQINGRAENNASIEVTWEGATRTTVANTSGFWSVTFDQAPAQGNTTVRAIAIDAGENRSAAAQVSVQVDTNPPATPSFNAVEGDNNITLAEAADGIQVTGRGEAGSTVRVNWAGQSRDATVNGNGNWGVTFGDAPTQGQSVIEVAARDAAGNQSGTASQTVTANTLPPPPAPTISVVEGDNQINAAEAADGVQLSGRSQAGSTVNLLWNGVSTSAQADGNGFWSATFNQVPTQGSSTITATATNSSQTASEQTSIQVTADTNPPATPTFNPVEGDNSITLTEAANGIQVTGRGEAGTTVRVNWAGASQDATVDGNGNWGVTFGSAPVQGPSTIEASARDSFGNQSGTASQSVTANTLPPPPAPNIATVEGDNVINAAEASDGVQVTGQAQAGATINLLWNGATATAQANGSGFWSSTFAQVPSQGVSTITATASNGSSTSSDPGSVQVTVDTNAPATPTINAVEGDNVITFAEAANGIQVSGTAEAGSSVRINWAGAERTVQAGGNGVWSTQFDSAPAQGAATINVVSRDAAGNQSGTASQNVTANTLPPPGAPTINPVTADGVVNASEANAGVTITGSAQAGASVAVTWGGTTVTVAANGAGNWSAGFSGAQIPASSATISAVASNASGSSQPGTLAVTIDRVAPGAASIAPVTGDDVVTLAEAAGGVLVQGNAEANAIVQITWGIEVATVQANGAGNWQTTFTSLPPAGASTINVRATDAAGNVGPATNRNVTIDNTPPPPTAPTINPVEGNDAVNAAEAADGVVISGAAVDGATVQVTWGGTVLSDVASGGQYSVTYTGAQIPSGNATVSAHATNAGGTSAVTTRPVAVDTTAPGQPTINAVEGNDEIIASEAADGIQVTGSAEPGSSIAVTLNGQTVTGNVNGAGNWAVTLTAVPADGAYQIEAVATDAAGNTGASQSRPVTVDTQGPTQLVTIADILDDVGPDTGSVPNGGVTDDAQPQITVQLDAPRGVGETVLLFANGSLVTTSSSGTTSFDFTPGSDLADGQYSFAAQLRDSNGNLGSLSALFQIEIDAVP